MTPAGWSRSLEGRLVLRLSALILLTMAAGFGALVFASIHAARELSEEALADRFVGEFLRDAAWLFPVFAAVLLAVVVWTIRGGLQPVRRVSAEATAIGPQAPGGRLSLAGLPSEITPLVGAANQALDRLEEGFQAQRRFTADAAHELRTPLTILTAGLDSLEDTDEVAKMRDDVARMNRLVQQLLRVARLNAKPLARRERLDLSTVAASTAEHLAPWCVAEGHPLGLDLPDQPVWVFGDPDALADALRNLIENAVVHTPIGVEINVSVAASGVMTVADSGPGVPTGERTRIFERFVRLRGGAPKLGSGLGLSIVAEIVKAHGGGIEVADVPGGGGVFKVSIPLAGQGGPA